MAVLFDQTGETLHQWAILHSAIAIEGPTPARLGELRAILNAHGLGGPKSLQQLRWRIETPATETPVPNNARRAQIDRRTRILARAAQDE